MPKHILVVAEEEILRMSRVALLEQAGYRVEYASSDDEAMRLLKTEMFDLVLLGRNSDLHRKNIDQRLREKYPNLLTLKIVNEHDRSDYASRLTTSEPDLVIDALRQMLGPGVKMVPVEIFVGGSEDDGPNTLTPY